MISNINSNEYLPGKLLIMTQKNLFQKVNVQLIFIKSETDYILLVFWQI